MGTAPIDDVSSGTPDRNVFKDNTIRRCNGFGVYVYANNSTVADNKFYFTAGTSIFASFEGNTITGNFITGSGNDGIGLTSGERVVVAGNLIVNSAKDGIDLQPESIRRTVKDNTVNKCGSEGLQVRGDFHIITGNKITKCSTGIEVIVGADNNRLTNNKVSGSTLFDLSDLSANCGSNIWNGNTRTGKYCLH
jgi:parallel beta-helix repeat protein